jgi:hypothetical protein
MRHGGGDSEPTLSQTLVTVGGALIALHALHSGPATTCSLAADCRSAGGVG